MADTLSRYGDLKRSSGDRETARRSYDEALAIARKLAMDTDNVQAQLSAAFALAKVGDIQFQSTDLTGAQNAFSEQVVILQRLADQDQLTGMQRNWLVEENGKLAAIRAYKRHND